MKVLVRFFGMVLLVFACLWSNVTFAQHAKVSQKKIEHEKKIRQRDSMRAYNKGLKQHFDNQSKETRTMMNKSRKQAKKSMPVRKK